MITNYFKEIFDKVRNPDYKPKTKQKVEIDNNKLKVKVINPKLRVIRKTRT